MQAPPTDTRSLQQAGMDALRKGDARRAHELFSGIVASGRADSSVWLGLAFACRSLGDSQGKLDAIDKVLALEPRNLRALILKGDHLAEAGDGRAASAFYGAALRAAPAPNQLPPDLAQDIQRAQAMRERYAKEYEAHLREKLAAQGFSETQSSRRFAYSMDLLLGKKQLYLQQPLFYYFPGLPQIQFYERSSFPWLDALEAATGDIRTELIEVMKHDGAFSPYVEGKADRPPMDMHGMQNNPDWSAFYLWKDGEIVPENAGRCPKTVAAMKNIPLTQIKNRTPSVLFSLLRPGAHIPAHHGFINVRLICHLPLIVPGNCSFRVGNDVRNWQEGKAWVFDDTMEHEAWNRSDKTRVILLFDIWRPELSDEERKLVAAMFEAIDSYGKSRTEWNI